MGDLSRFNARRIPRAVLWAGAAMALLPACGSAQTASGSGGAAQATGGSAASGSSTAAATAGLPQDSNDVAADTGGPPAPPAPLGTLLPPLGANPTDPSLRGNLLDAFGQSTPAPPGSANKGPAWQFSPQITVSEQYTNNPGVVGGFNSFAVPTLRGGANQASGSDFVTLIAPQISVSESGERLRVSLFYAPTGEIFAENAGYSQFRQQFNGDVLGTLMPGLIYADLRGSVFQQPVFGGLGPINTTVLPPNQRETISTVSATPYLARGFGGLGSLQAGIGYVYTATDAPAYLNQQASQSIGLPNTYGSSWLADRRVFATFTTGEDFGRVQDSLATDSNFYDASGALRNGQRVLVTNDASYAINRFAAALGEIGYENLNYPNEGFSYVGGVWAAGTRITPNAVSTVTLEYRYIDGFYSPYAFGSWQVTPRLRIFGGYSEGITSFDQDQQNNLLSGNVNATGAAASGLVAAPLLNNGAYSGSNQGLNHDRRLTATAAYLIDRDTVTLSFNWTRETQVGNPAAVPTSAFAALGISPAVATFDINYVLKYGIPSYIQPGPFLNVLQQVLDFNRVTTLNSSNIVAGISWHHDLQPTISSDIYVGYTRALQAETTLTASDGAQVSVGLSQNFTDKLTGRIGYAGTFFLNGSLGTYTRNNQSVTASLTRKF